MASIQKRPDGRYRARYRDESGKEHARHFKLKKDAQRWLDEVAASVVTGRYVDPGAGKITFRQWFDQWSARQIWTAGTLETAQMAAYSTTFVDVRMGDLRPSHVQAWVKSMSQRLAASTIRTRFNFVHMCLRAAVQDKIIAEDPSERTPLPRLRKAEAAMTIPTPEQVRSLLDAAGEDFRPFVAVCAFAGLRLGEAAALQLGDVDFLRRTIMVQRQVQGATVAKTEIVPPKYGSERTIFAADELLEIISEHVRNGGPWGSEQWLFGSARKDLFTRTSAGHKWRRARVKAKLDEFTLHDLRHFFASGLIADGCDVVTVQRALGHSSANITLGIYAHLWPTAEDRTRKAASGLAAQVLADSLRTYSSVTKP